MKSKNEKPVDLEIDVSLDVPYKNKIKIHDNLPIIPFYLLSCGAGNSGKTLSTVSLIDKYYKHFKKSTIIFTHSRCPTLMKMAEKFKAHVFNDIYGSNGNRIEAILKLQEDREKNDLPVKNMLLIFDDFITSDETNKRKGSLTKLFSMARHFSVSMVFTSQSWTLIPPPVRRMATDVIVFATANMKELRSMADELCGFVSEDEWRVLFEVATSEKHNFLYCQVLQKKFLKNFTSVLKSAYEDE